MSIRGRVFLSYWVAQNIEGVLFSSDLDDLNMQVAAMVDDAKAVGIERRDLAEEVGDLGSFLSGLINSPVDGL